MFSVEGKKILVSGGSRGLGRAISEGLAKQGAEIFIAARDQVSLSETRSTITSEGNICHAVMMNVTSDKGVNEAVESVLDLAEGRIDVLINNAGMSAENAKAEEISEKN